MTTESNTEALTRVRSTWLPLSRLPTAHRCRDLAEKSPDSALVVLAKNLDLPMEDAESLSFLRQALADTYKELRTIEARDKLAHLENSNER